MSSEVLLNTAGGILKGVGDAWVTTMRNNTLIELQKMREADAQRQNAQSREFNAEQNALTRQHDVDSQAQKQQDAIDLWQYKQDHTPAGPAKMSDQELKGFELGKRGWEMHVENAANPDLSPEMRRNSAANANLIRDQIKQKFNIDLGAYTGDYKPKPERLGLEKEVDYNVGRAQEWYTEAKRRQDAGEDQARVGAALTEARKYSDRADHLAKYGRGSKPSVSGKGGGAGVDSVKHVDFGNGNGTHNKGQGVGLDGAGQSETTTDQVGDGGHEVIDATNEPSPDGSQVTYPPGHPLYQAKQTTDDGQEVSNQGGNTTGSILGGGHKSLSDTSLADWFREFMSSKQSNQAWPEMPQGWHPPMAVPRRQGGVLTRDNPSVSHGVPNTGTVEDDIQRKTAVAGTAQSPSSPLNLDSANVAKTVLKAGQRVGNWIWDGAKWLAAPAVAGAQKVGEFIEEGASVAGNLDRFFDLPGNDMSNADTQSQPQQGRPDAVLSNVNKDAPPPVNPVLQTTTPQADYHYRNDIATGLPFDFNTQLDIPEQTTATPPPSPPPTQAKGTLANLPPQADDFRYQAPLPVPLGNVQNFGQYNAMRNEQTKRDDDNSVSQMHDLNQTLQVEAKKKHGNTGEQFKAPQGEFNGYARSYILRDEGDEVGMVLDEGVKSWWGMRPKEKGGVLEADEVKELKSLTAKATQKGLTEEEREQNERSLRSAMSRLFTKYTDISIEKTKEIIGTTGWNSLSDAGKMAVVSLYYWSGDVEFRDNDHMIGALSYGFKNLASLDVQNSKDSLSGESRGKALRRGSVSYALDTDTLDKKHADLHNFDSLKW